MITNLFNQTFKVERNYPVFKDGIIEDHFTAIGTAKGRLSYPKYSDRTLFQSRGLTLSAIIYLDVYDYDEQRDILISDEGIRFGIKDLSAFRDGGGKIAYLKIPVSENLNLAVTQSGSESDS